MDHHFEYDRRKIAGDFIRWVRIDSPSAHEQKISAEIIKRLKKSGLAVETDKAGNIRGYLRASAGFKKYPWRLFSAHIDTVEPGRGICPVVTQNGLIHAGGKTILGADDKDGLTAIILALEYILEKKLRHPGLEFLFTVREEMATAGSRELAANWLKSKQGWIFDGAGRIGTIYNGAVGAAEFKIEVTGKAAHSGICPENGINALKTAANAVARMPLGRLADNHTVNIGLFQSGMAMNIVPPQAELIGEARSTNVKRIRQSLALIKRIFREESLKTGASFVMRHKLNYYPYKLNGKSDFIRTTSGILSGLGINPDVRAIKAGTDANNLVRLGMEILVLATGREKNHSVNETTSIGNLYQAMRVAVALMAP